MLAIPIVKNLSELEDTTSMVSCLVNQHMAAEDVVRADVRNLQQYRSAAVSVSDASESSQQQLLRYCQQLRNFAPRFVGLEPQLKVTLSWSDAFGVSMKASASSFYMDLACCYWNLAAFESLMGARLDRTSEEGLRAANKHFQQAAGYIEHIRVNILHQLPPLGNYPCMSDDGLNMVKNLMLAQGQLCFYEKAVKDKKKDANAMKSGIIAKLAKQTSAFYHATSIACKVGVLGSMLDISWFAVTEFQSKCFQGAAEYWQAHASKEAAQAVGTGYGEEVARYNRADTQVGLALAQAGKFAIAESLMFGANGLRAAIQQYRQTAEHDLKTVYMESVPNDFSLPEVGCVAMVRPLPVPEISEPGVVLFRYVLPQAVRLANAKYAEDVSAVSRSTEAAAENASNTARTTLSAKGLPGSLEAAKTENPLPPSLWAKVQRVQAMGGVTRLDTMFEDLRGAARRTLQSMATIDESLDREERTDDDFRKLNPEFPGTSSRVLTADVRTNNNRMRDAYRNAQISDKQIETDLQSEEAKEQLAIVSKSHEELMKLFPRDAPNLLDYDEKLDRPVELPEVTQLEDKLHELAALIEKRTQEVAELQKIVAVDITELANDAISKSQDITTVHSTNLTRAQEIQMRVMMGVSQQDALLQEIMSLNDAFCRSKVNSPLAVQRSKVIQQIEQAVAKFSLIHSQITAGITFYHSLQSKLTTLTQTADDLAYTQQWQRQEHGAQRSCEMEKTTQEMSDRDYALKLSNEMSATPTAVPTPGMPVAVPGGYPSLQHAPPPGQQPAGSYPAHQPQGPAATPVGSNLVYGTPVSGPPPNLIPYHPNQAPAAVPGGPTPAPQYHQQQQPQYQQQQQYQQQYQQYGAPTAVPSHPHNPAYNPNLYGASPPPPGAVPHQGYSPQPAAPQTATSPYGAYPALPNLGQQAVPQQQQQPGYQYNTSSYNVATSPNQPGQQPPQQQAPAPMNPAELHAKTMRLCEMGFAQDQASAALQANGGNEEAALNSLLAGPAPAEAQQTASSAAPAAAAAKPSGLFGRMWGSK